MAHRVRVRISRRVEFLVPIVANCVSVIQFRKLLFMQVLDSVDAASRLLSFVFVVVLYKGVAILV